MRSPAWLWARCGQRGKGGREGGEREESKEKAFALLSRCGGKKKGEKRGRKEAPGTRWYLPLALFFPWVINT